MSMDKKRLLNRRFAWGIVLLFVTDFAAANPLSDELQWLAKQIACIGQYNSAQTGDYTLGDPHDYYKPSDIRDYLTGLSGERTRTQTFYGICFDYAQAAYDDITQYRSHYESLGMQKNGWYIVSDGTSSRQIILYDPVMQGQHTLRINGVYVKEKERRTIQTHENAKNHAWLWVLGNDGTIYWIDPTWTDNTGYVWWGIVRDGKEIQLAPLESVCMVKINSNAPSFESFNSGNASKNMGDWDQAIIDYTAALRREPNNAAAYSNRGWAYAEKGDFDRAIADCNSSLRIDPNNAAAYSNRGWAYAEKGDFDRAIADCTSSLRIDPNNAAAYSNRGWAYTEKGDYDRAIADCTAALRLNQNLATAYSNRGWAYTEKGDYDRAIADCTAALRLNSDLTAALNNRGLAYLRKGDYDRAIMDFDAVLKINPNFTIAKNNLELAKRRGR